MSALLDGIGLVSGVLGIVSFFQDNVPGNQAEGATITIKAGLPQGDEDPSTGGGVGAVYGFDTNNNFIGQGAGGDTGGDGGVFTTTLDQSTPGVQAAYVSVEGTGDALCMAWVTVTQFDGTPDGWWTGDVGYSCGQDWYYGVETAGYYKDTSDEWKPYCAWVDSDHTNDIANAAMKFRSRAYGSEASDTIANSNACGATLWGGDTGPINGPTGKRAVRERKQWMKEKLISSNFSKHTAADLCGHPNSHGPDFIGSDGKFCDMESKTVHTVCSIEDVDGCVDLDAESKTLKKRHYVPHAHAKRTVHSEFRSYKTFDQWE